MAASAITERGALATWFFGGSDIDEGIGTVDRRRDDSRKAAAVIKRFRLLHRFILPSPPHQPDEPIQDTAVACEHRVLPDNPAASPRGPAAPHRPIIFVERLANERSGV
ncbi:hypothetical protein BN2476_670086 [Paraburkholderia piptadeniae]|uniref:Uncharacterized protein n=1 Tax=Paraburkholderia piptadeniae TaxID=1701573 RepID=A0A1N7SNL3_9BURK|nr:hypothetical protein BN2476_670086 [Paraburkholderia piptadeniae]